MIVRVSFLGVHGFYHDINAIVGFVASGLNADRLSCRVFVEQRLPLAAFEETPEDHRRIIDDGHSFFGNVPLDLLKRRSLQNEFHLLNSIVESRVPRGIPRCLLSGAEATRQKHQSNLDDSVSVHRFLHDDDQGQARCIQPKIRARVRV